MAVAAVTERQPTAVADVAGASLARRGRERLVSRPGGRLKCYPQPCFVGIVAGMRQHRAGDVSLSQRATVWTI